ncbi:MAG: TAXI family TRAP transporter solute-binding subunit [Aminobacterium sp.]|jgi:TRAP transporter TAXI family solute receptor|uniref:TAXI family TRAP transporter solute-binding subunit n=1 Tax=Aminobacterium sp. TaxID=1872491 RepID=UPI001BCC9CF8|nr:TAXI family TRAP transporter solute-binding subunit [Aminobacterium sp.]MDD2206684.1 TAXI family TRAP transporter solute-binding subunit [Aminobacterium sp.]MDD3425321.1 TAXI family TRAP transporter solute-binding subunit [Aminobacterium sp.]MDD4228846.1 TAXI family TRAP transporter solute-binding subunit [Aminobacterium sp.]MEA4878184.1 TAXI family TRAP transporter solute-binding subunit [Aminobacterium sp.]
MRKYGKGFVVFLTMVLVLGMSFSAMAVERYSLATGGTAGTYYPIGSAIASIITKYVPNIEVTAESTGASVANLKMIREGNVEMMMGASNTSYGAFSGQPPFEKEPVENIRGITCLYPEIFQFVVLKDSNLKSIKDLAGKKVAVGAPGSGTERTAKMVLEAHGLGYDKISPQFLNFGEAVTALKDRLIDCAIIGSGIPTSAVVDASTTLDVNLLSLDSNIMKDFLKDRSYLTMVTIPGGTYRGVNEDVSAVASPALLIARKDLSEESVYQITKALFEHLDVLADSHAQGKMIRFETALSAMSIPLHAGAARYYKEKGVDVSGWVIE